MIYVTAILTVQSYSLTIKQATMARIFAIKKAIIYQCHDASFCSAVRFYSFYMITQ